MTRRLLIVEHDAAVRQGLRQQLATAGYTVADADTGQLAIDMARAERFDLILLDVVLADLDGITVCRAIRAAGPNQDTPLVMLTARSSEADKVLGLESGADDYLTKPVAARELQARLAAVLRRAQDRPAPLPIRARAPIVGDLTVDFQRRDVRLRGAAIDLTTQEFDLLAVLAAHRGIVFSRAALLARVWHDAPDVTERTVDAVVSRIRKKIEDDPQHPRWLLTAWGAGYKFTDHPADAH